MCKLVSLSFSSKLRKITFVALETTISDQEVRLSAAEENIQGTLVNFSEVEIVDVQNTC